MSTLATTADGIEATLGDGQLKELRDAIRGELADLVGPMPYSARQKMLDEPNATHGLHRYWRSAFTEKVSDEIVDVLVDAASHFSSPLSVLIFFHMHGAAARVPPAETAFAARRTQWDFDAISQWSDAVESA
jgi:hypothetical protein